MSKKIDPVKISYYFLDFCLQNFSKLFAPTIERIDSEHIGNFRPDMAIKNIFNIKEGEDFNLIALCDNIKKISNPDEQEEFKLLASELLADVFVINFNCKDKDLPHWQRFTLVKLSDFLKFIEKISADNTLHIRYMHKLKNHVNELFGDNSEKEFDFDNMTIQYAIDLIMNECEAKLAVAEMLDEIYYGESNSINFAKADKLLQKSSELIKELIIDSCDICMNSIKFDCLVEMADLSI